MCVCVSVCRNITIWAYVCLFLFCMCTITIAKSFRSRTVLQSINSCLILLFAIPAPIHLWDLFLVLVSGRVPSWGYSELENNFRPLFGLISVLKWTQDVCICVRGSSCLSLLLSKESSAIFPAWSRLFGSRKARCSSAFRATHLERSNRCAVLVTATVLGTGWGKPLWAVMPPGPISHPNPCRASGWPTAKVCLGHHWWAGNWTGHWVTFILALRVCWS